MSQALELLRGAADKTVVLVIDEAQHALVWKSNRGGYALEDKAFADWLKGYRKQP